MRVGKGIFVSREWSIFVRVKCEMLDFSVVKCDLFYSRAKAYIRRAKAYIFICLTLVYRRNFCVNMCTCRRVMLTYVNYRCLFDFSIEGIFV
jgi:hypothetical protein